MDQRSSGQVINHGDDSHQDFAAHSETTAFYLPAVKGSSDRFTLCNDLDP